MRKCLNTANIATDCYFRSFFWLITKLLRNDNIHSWPNTYQSFSTTYFIFRSLLLSEFNYQSIPVQSVICKIPTRFSRCFKTLQWSHACGHWLGPRYYSRFFVRVSQETTIAYNENRYFFTKPLIDRHTKINNIFLLQTKGQLISKAIYGVLDSPKKRTKKI